MDDGLFIKILGEGCWLWGSAVEFWWHWRIQCFWRENSALEHVLFIYIMFSVFVNKLIDRNKVFNL